MHSISQWHSGFIISLLLEAQLKWNYHLQLKIDVDLELAKFKRKATTVIPEGQGH